MRKLLVLVLAGLVLAATAVLAVLPATTVRAAAGTGPVWGACPPPEGGAPRDPRLRCAALPVPLDYRHPGGRTITVEISRIGATGPGPHRILLSNPGGPGGSGLDLPSVLAAFLPADVLARYDLIGFDPRGVGYSTPVTCGLDTTRPDLASLTLPYPAPDGSIARNVAFARTTAASCAARSGALLPFVTTANTARDMDRIRAALGAPKLSYLGVSYGTYLGAVYTTLFPRRSDRIVLDSSVDPRRVWYTFGRSWNEATALRFPDFTAWAAARDATYGLGATPAAVQATYYRLVAGLDRDPITLPTGLLLDGNLLREVTRSGLYADASFPQLASDWQQVAALLGSSNPAVPPSLVAATARLGGAAEPGAVPADNGISVVYGILCDDTAWPRDPSVYAANVATDRLAWPLTNGMPSNIWPCAFWPNRPLEPPVQVTDRGPRDVLLLQNTRDPATSLRSGLGMRAALGRRAAIVVVDEGGHGVYGLGSCADQVTNDYLAGGPLPRADRTCPAPAAPAGPSLRGSSTTATW